MKGKDAFHPQKHSHGFVETFDDIVAFGLDRKTDENAVRFYLQKFSDDTLMETILPRMTDDDLIEIFDTIGKMLRKYLKEPEYHRLFLKETP